jgi:hypothetical protein
MSKKSSINYRGFDFDFEYNYSPPYLGTWENPPEAEEYEIYNITLNGIDAEDLIDPMYDDFIEEVINNLKEY